VIWTVKVSSRAEKYFNRLDKDLKNRIKSELEALSGLENPLDHRQVRPLTGELRGFFRLRVGDYRIIFAILDAEKIIAVVNIAPP